MMKDGEISEIVWYTNTFNCNFSEDGDLSLDGIILEIFRPRNSWLYTAIDIVKEAKQIVVPTKGKMLTPNEAKSKGFGM